MTVTINGSTGIDKVQDGTIQSADFAAGVPGRSNLPAGTVLQVVQSVKSSSLYSTTINTWLDTGLSASITPTSSTSKILVQVNLGRVISYSVAFRLYRNGSVVSAALGDASGSDMQAWFISGDNDGTHASNGSMQYLDSPSSTSAQTYSVYANSYYSPWGINQGASSTSASYGSRTIATITLMEIAA